VHRTSRSFWTAYRQLPQSVQQSAVRSFQLLSVNSSHPSLHFEKAGDFWMARVDRNHRAVALWDGEDFLWIWVGCHDEYERIIGSL
jgi:hypothetical protein